MARSLGAIHRFAIAAAGTFHVALLLSPLLAAPPDAEYMTLGGSAAVSPDGSLLVFEWAGDLWRVPVAGGEAQPLTRHPARESDPVFSPDGSQLAFSSDRGGSLQTYVAAADSGAGVQRTFHSEGSVPQDWFPDGSALLVRGKRDAAGPAPERFFRVPAGSKGGEKLLFNDRGDSSHLSMEGTRLLFTREGGQLYRKGYRGSRASQIWVHDLSSGAFRKLREDAGGCRWPRWTGEGSSIFYVGAQSGSFNLRRFDPETGEDRQLTFFVDDAVMFPVVSRDGGVVVFRRLFHYYRWRPREGGDPERIEIWNRSDRPRETEQRKLLKEAGEVAFSADGLEVAMICGGELWVMDTTLRDPVLVAGAGQELRSPVFSPEGDDLYVVRDGGDRVEVLRIRRKEPEEFWWRNREFEVEALTDGTRDRKALTVSPDGGNIAYVEGRGDLVTTDRDGKNRRVLLESFNEPAYAWSPDGRWLAWAVYDADFNRDVWIRAVEGDEPAHNVSRHPDNEDGPVWSPDGKMLAFTGRRLDDEPDIFYLWLTREAAQQTARDRKLEEALKRMREERGAGSGTAGGGELEEEGGKKAEVEKGEGGGEEARESRLPEVRIEFEDLHRRIRHLSIPGAEEKDLFWSPDGKKLAFSAEIDGKEGCYAVDLYAEDPKPEALMERSGSFARWLEKDDRIVWLSGGVPGSFAKGKYESYDFEARQSVDRAERQRLGFLQAWRLMRDHYYDGMLGGRDWDTIRRKYEEAATAAPDEAGYGRVMALMLGELNGSHLGFRSADEGWNPDDAWSGVTPWLGLAFDPGFSGAGFRVAGVVPDGPADRENSRIRPGEVLVAVDGKPADVETDWAELVNGPLERTLVLRIRDGAGQEREVSLRPVSYEEGRRTAGAAEVLRKQNMVERMSEGQLVYVKVRSMDWPSFQDFEKEIYAMGSGKKGLVIDVRDNSGGFTADHLLTVLSQPSHALTAPRGGAPGYPQDRKVYASWPRPVVVLCNQNSFSNAEIFAHAVKTLGRGKLVGAPTAGGVISTGSRKILDLGTLRMPTRGWHVLGTGEDMELNGAVPDVIVWPHPGEIAAGYDRQLEKGVEVLLEEVRVEAARQRSDLRKASERARGD
ncbi:MAG TPA: S41 family peptidase [Verrucomicrobiales bacterium]|nr:S41 family peptidase [Verrucomicrobiales bacterium]